MSDALLDSFMFEDANGSGSSQITTAVKAVSTATAAGPTHVITINGSTLDSACAHVA